MNLLLDAHAFLWFVRDDPLLSTTAKAAIVSGANRKLVSVATCWEIAIKVCTNKLTLGEPTLRFFVKQLAANHFDLLTIALHHATAVDSLPFHHRDPFDRLLVAQTLADGLAMVSRDKVFDQYGVTRIW